MVKTRDRILNTYQNNAEDQRKRISDLKKQLNKISFSRLGLFVAEILIIALIINSGYHWIFGILTVIPLFLFLYLIKKQVTVQGDLAYAERLLWVYQNEIDQLTAGKNGYSDGQAYADEYHPYTSDLDVFGAGSLYAYINRCNTQPGLDLLAANFNRPNPKQTILERQQAVTELGLYIDQTFHFRARLQDHKPEQLRQVKAKLEEQLPAQLAFTERAWLKFYVKAAPLVSISALILGLVFGGDAWRLFGLVAVFNAGLIFFNMKSINQVHMGFTGSATLLDAFSGAILWTESISWKSPYIHSFFSGQQQGLPVSMQIRRLSKIIQAFDARLNFLLAFVLNLFLLWDLKCSIQLGLWYHRYAAEVMKGLDRISCFEELISLATLQYNQPEWNLPGIADDFHFEAIALGHPLIHADERVVNDFSLEGQPTTAIVTGSNMAGKSTFLRTVGINMVLAFAGAVVCAESMSVSIFKVLSYMRIKDSLNDHTSTFKAELNRLKMILDTITVADNAFVLIDEMLRGTNSRDKYLGSKVFLEKLITENTPALFATHDLQLSEMKTQYPEQIRNYHFDIQIAAGEMKFDYLLKTGPCKTFNAALLLKEIGLTLN